MPYHYNCYILLSFLAYVLSGCSGETEAERDIPEEISGMANVEILEKGAHPINEVTVTQENIYGSTDEVFVNAIGDAAVDDSGRVYIAEITPGSAAIYVFDPDGQYITQIGRRGRGPGEYRTIRGIDIFENSLYVFESNQRIHEFSLTDFSLVNGVLVDNQRVQGDQAVVTSVPGEYFLVNESGYLSSFRGAQSSVTMDRPLLFHYIDREGYIQPEEIVRLKMFEIYDSGSSPAPGRPGIFSTSFSRSSLIDMDDEGRIYTAWTDDFLIEVHDREGEYKRAYYYPYDNAGLSLSDMGLSNGHIEIIRDADPPDTWPALHEMMVDDRSRIWAVTITDSEDYFQVYVLNRNGELWGKFRLEGSRISRDNMASDVMLVKNNNIYVERTHPESGEDYIARYRISAE